MFPGANWWKFDFHSHSPASIDYGKGPNQQALREITPDEWLLGYMRAGIDCVAITDHNSGGWIDRLKEALQRLEQGTNADYRPLYLFPGVEITSGGIHILAIFDSAARSAEIDRLLGAVHARSAEGSSDAACDYSPVQVVSTILSSNGIPIFAHVDEPCGLFNETEGNSLTPVLDSQSVFAMEQRNPAFLKPALYNDRKLTWAEVIGSDSHHPDDTCGDRFPGSHYTWIKMGEPSLEGLRLALLDNAPLSVRRSDQCTDNPNSFASLFIEEMQIEEARYCGRGTPLMIRLNPWLNAVIGGRGSGKSTLVEFMRIALQRENELPESLVKSFGEFNQVNMDRDSKGALTDNTKIKLIVNKDGARYYIQWSQDGSLPPIMQEIAGGEWEVAPGDVRQRFPVRIFSQKQVYALSEESEALMKILDETPEVDRSNWDEDWKLEQSKFLSSRAKFRELRLKLGEEGNIKGQLDDVIRKLQLFEGAAHAKLLKEYQLRQRQKQAVDNLNETLDSYEKTLRDAAEILVPPVFERDIFDSTVPEGLQALVLVDDATTKVRELSEEALVLANKALLTKESTTAAFVASEWTKQNLATQTAYDELVESFRGQGIADPSQYASLVRQRGELEAQLKDISEVHVSLDIVIKEILGSMDRLISLRKDLTTNRTRFLTEALGDNRHVRINVVPFRCSKLSAEQQFRAAIERIDNVFASDILSENQQEGLIAELYKNLPENTEEASIQILERLNEMKNRLLASAYNHDDTHFGVRFNKHLRQVHPETLDRVRCWFPEDGLSVEYSPKGDGRDFKPLEQGSPGQKTAAILAFLLAHGNEPIVLDQPEDDLDNHLIYDLIVSQVRENKQRRQVIIVTHNPNIVVNGDAEAVFALDQRRGQCRIVAQGCLQSLAVRDEVCRILEGGREAFEKRYKRIISSIPSR